MDKAFELSLLEVESPSRHQSVSKDVDSVHRSDLIDILAVFLDCYYLIDK